MKRSGAVVVLVLISAIAFALSGCVFAAVHAGRYIERKANPPQPILRADASFFDHALDISMGLRPAVGRDGGQKARMILWIVLKNTSGSKVEFSVRSVKSLLGQVVEAPEAFALAPGQKVFLGPLRSEHEPNLEKLEVALSLERSETVENQTVVLLPVPPK